MQEKEEEEMQKDKLIEEKEEEMQKDDVVEEEEMQKHDVQE